jgi:hypothetical protein
VEIEGGIYLGGVIMKKFMKDRTIDLCFALPIIAIGFYVGHYLLSAVIDPSVNYFLHQ